MRGVKRNMKNMKIDANGTEITVMGDVVNEDAYISLTDIAKYKNPDNAFIVVANWMRSVSYQNRDDMAAFMLIRI